MTKEQEEELFDEPAIVETETVDAPEPEVEPEKPEIPEGAVKAEVPPPEQPMVPLAALHEVRDELKQLRAEAERNRQKHQEQPQKRIDPWEDLEGALGQQASQFQQQLYQQQVIMSERFARQSHGDEAVNAAIEWAKAKCDADPYFNAQVMESGDPVGYAVQQFNRDQIASKVDLSEFEQFQAWKQAQAAAQGTPQTQTSEIPPRSIASAPSAGGAQQMAMGDGAVFDEEFK